MITLYNKRVISAILIMAVVKSETKDYTCNTIFPTKILPEIYFFGAVVGNGSCNQLILCNLYYFTILQLGMGWIHNYEYLFVYQTFSFGTS